MYHLVEPINNAPLLKKATNIAIGQTHPPNIPSVQGKKEKYFGYHM